MKNYLELRQIVKDISYVSLPTYPFQFSHHSHILAQAFDRSGQNGAAKKNPSTWHILRMINLKESL